MESESDPLTRRPVDVFEKEPLKGNSEVHLHTPTKFGEDRSKDLGGDREQTDRQTDKRCSIYSMIFEPKIKWRHLYVDQTATIKRVQRRVAFGVTGRFHNMSSNGIMLNELG